eukprot:3303976-Pyramimonas_sp.AAC.1
MQTTTATTRAIMDTPLSHRFPRPPPGYDSPGRREEGGESDDDADEEPRGGMIWKDIDDRSWKRQRHTPPAGSQL